MEGIITVKEERGTFNKLKEWRDNAVKKISEMDSRDILVKVLDFASITTMAVGSVATIIASVSPAAVMAPAIAKVAVALSGIAEGAKLLLSKTSSATSKVYGAQRLTAALSDFQGGIKDISIPDKNIIPAADLEPANGMQVQN